MERRCVCGWCPLELPDDHLEWAAHFLVAHRATGHSVRFYPAFTEAQEIAMLLSLDESPQPRER